VKIRKRDVFIQFQFQFFTLNLEKSDKTKSRGVDCDRANLDNSFRFLFGANSFLDMILMFLTPLAEVTP